MRMAAWHGADHIMVIRTTGQSHIDGLLEGTPEGIGGIPITRKQLRATRKALDLIEDEVGRPINFHSYVSGVAGPEIAVLFAEEGVNGAHQDPQYNVLYRNVNMQRSFVDAAVAKKIMASCNMLQIDGAHNANATAREAWKVMPELLVQHAINCAFSEAVGMKKENIALSSVPPTAPPAPALAYDLPYAVCLRWLFSGYKIRAQQNTRYIESDTREATVTHVLNLLVSRLTSADVQSTITPDEGRNVPWHYNNIAAVETAKQTLLGLDGFKEMVELKKEGPLPAKVRSWPSGPFSSWKRSRRRATSTRWLRASLSIPASILKERATVLPATPTGGGRREHRQAGARLLCPGLPPFRVQRAAGEPAAALRSHRRLHPLPPGKNCLHR